MNWVSVLFGFGWFFLAITIIFSLHQLIAYWNELARPDFYLQFGKIFFSCLMGYNLFKLQSEEND